MNRTEWKAFHHSIRADARAFQKQHGGFPCFTRHLTHNGTEWSITRRTENRHGGWQTNLRTTLLRQRAWQALAARALNECQEYHAEIKRSRNFRNPNAIQRRAIRSAVEEARTTRENAEWARLHTATDKSSRYAA